MAGDDAAVEVVAVTAAVAARMRSRAIHQQAQPTAAACVFQCLFTLHERAEE